MYADVLITTVGTVLPRMRAPRPSQLATSSNSAACWLERALCPAAGELTVRLRQIRVAGRVGVLQSLVGIPAMPQRNWQRALIAVAALLGVKPLRVET